MIQEAGTNLQVWQGKRMEGEITNGYKTCKHRAMKDVWSITIVSLAHVFRYDSGCKMIPANDNRMFQLYMNAHIWISNSCAIPKHSFKSGYKLNKTVRLGWMNHIYVKLLLHSFTGLEYIVFNAKTIKYITNQSNFFTYYPLCLFYLVWRSSDYKYFLRRIWRWSPIQLTVCTSLLINLFDCLTSYTIKEYSKNLIISHFLMEEDNSEHIIIEHVTIYM